MAVSYVVNYRVHGTTLWTTWTTTSSTATILGANPPGPPLAAGTDYDVEIIAENSFGSTTSAVASASTPGAVSITAITLSNQTFTAGSPVNTVVGAIAVTLSAGTFSGTLALGGTNAADFEIVGTNLKLASATIAAGTYAITITATQTGASNSPFSQSFPGLTASPSLTESAEGFVVTTVGPIMYASESRGVADPNGPWNQFALIATNGGEVTLNGTATPSGSVTEIIYHNHTCYQTSPQGWWYWNTATSAWVEFGASAVTLSTTSYPAGAVANTVIGSISVTMKDASAFSGTLVVGGTNASAFQIVGSNLESAVTLSASTYSITITAIPAVTTDASHAQIGEQFTATEAMTASTSKQAGTRFPYPTATAPAWPYTYNSVWNIGIGSGALFSGANGVDPVTTNLQSVGAIVLSDPGIANNEWTYPLYVGASTDTVFNWTGATGWPGQTTPQTGTIHVPANAVASSDSDVQLLVMDSTQPTLFMSFDNSAVLNRTNNTLTGGIWSHWDTSGSGRANFGQGNLHVPLQGVDMDSITNGGGINRMLPCHIEGTMAMAWGPVSNWGNSITSLGFYNCVWPAIASDYDGGTGSGGGGYSGQIPFGSVLFIPKSVIDMTAWSFGGTNPLGLSLAGMAMAKQLQNYGLHVENTGGSFMIYTSWDIHSTTARTTRYNELTSVLNGTTLLQYMRVMKSWMTGMSAGQTPATPPGAGYQYDPNYNPSAPVNGGGTYPLPPPYWDPSLPTTFTSQNTY